jgi:hypothetical protein
MTVLSVCQNVSLVIGIEKPDQVFASTDREYMELARLANEMAQAIADEHDWQKLQGIHTITGDGATEAQDLPSDYDRMLKTASVWSSRWTWAFNHINDPDVWLEYQVVPYTFVNGNWIIYGDQMHVLPIMESTETIKFFYISKNRITPASGSNKPLFTADDDTFRLDERLLELGMIWQWRANKGLSYEEDLVNYQRLLKSKMQEDAGSQSIVSGNRLEWKRGGGAWAFPQTVGT